MRRATSAAGAPSGSQTISIHALHEEGDKRILFYMRYAAEFLSTPSMRRATLSKRY